MAAIAINVAANTSLPGRRGPIHPDGGFTYVPIPERRPTADPVPTYTDLELADLVPEDATGRAVHLDPTFAGYRSCVDYTYGDEHWVKARPISQLSAGDYLFFYATLSPSGPPERDWIDPDWGVYLIGHFRLARSPLVEPADDTFSAQDRRRFQHNAHVKRAEFDAKVLVQGDPDGSQLYDRAVPLCRPDDGSRANDIVTTLAGDSGKGPWWRRPLRFADHERLLARVSAATSGD